MNLMHLRTPRLSQPQKKDPKSKRIKGPMSSHVNDVNGSTGSTYAVSLNIRLFIRILAPNMCRIHHWQRCNVTSFLEPDDRISQDQNNAHFHPLHRLHLASKSQVINLCHMVKHPVCQQESVLSPDVITTLHAASIKLMLKTFQRHMQFAKCIKMSYHRLWLWYVFMCLLQKHVRMVLMLPSPVGLLLQNRTFAGSSLCFLPIATRITRNRWSPNCNENFKLYPV